MRETAAVTSRKRIAARLFPALRGEPMADLYNANLAEASRRLEESLRLLDPATQKIAHHLSFALLAICRELDRIGRDVERNSQALSAVLKEKADDNDAVRRTVRKKT